VAERVRVTVATLARGLGALGVAAACAFSFVPNGGCVANCPTVDRYYERGETLVAPNGAGVYETAPADGAFLPFEGGTVWHLRHGLGRVPTSVQVYTAFTEHPNLALAGGSSAGAGNESLILEVSDQDVVVKNDTCSGFYVRVVVTADVPADAGSAGSAPDAPSDAGGAAIDAPAAD
jgi:hypothetical protein